jgi:hypothetical protein
VKKCQNFLELSEKQAVKKLGLCCMQGFRSGFSQVSGSRSGSRRAENDPQSRKKFRNVMF